MLVDVYSVKMDGNKQLSRHFHLNEFRCGDGSDAVFVHPRLVYVLESIRSHFGRPVVIHSGYRTPTYNAEVGGKPLSQHQYGTAADISIRGIPPKDVAAYARQLLPDTGGIGIYKTFTHVDVREHRADWKG